MIEEFKDEIKSLRNILNEIKKIRIIKRTRNKWNKNRIKHARWWNKRYFRKVKAKFNNFRTKRQSFGNTHDLEEERELRLPATTKKVKSEIKRLRKEAENNKDELLDHSLDDENKFSKLLTDLEYEKHDALHNIVVLESKLIKLEISPERTDRIKNLVLSS